MGATREVSGADIGGSLWIVLCCAVAALAAIFYFGSNGQLARAKPLVASAAIIAVCILSFQYLRFERGIDTPFGRLTPEQLGVKIELGGWGTLIGLLLVLVGVGDLRDEQQAALPDSSSVPGTASLPTTRGPT